MIQTETTPNPNSLKFLSEKTLSSIGTEEFKINIRRILEGLQRSSNDRTFVENYELNQEKKKKIDPALFFFGTDFTFLRRVFLTYTLIEYIK